MKKLFTFLFALIAGIGTICASDTQVDGIYYDFDKTTQTATVTYRGDSYDTYTKEYSGAVTIPSSVSYNGITYSVTSIEKGAFHKCSSLTSVTIPNSVTSIGDIAFWCCSSLKSVTIPNSLPSIGWGAFYGCSSLTSVTIPNSVTTIEESAFEDCSSLTSVTIPNSVTTIGKYAFEGCSSLTSINVDAYNSKYSSADGVLFNKNKTTLIAYPGGKQGAYTIPNSVTSIGHEAFSGCTSLTSVTIPNSVTSIEEGAFSGCSSLTSVTIPNSVTTFGNYTFKYCSKLTSVTIPNSITNIGDEAFEACFSLTSVTIPNSVTNIGNGAFRECSSLTSVTIGNSVKSIRYEAFSGCSSLTSITIPNSVTTIGWNAFRDCSSLTSVTIPNSVTSIREFAFYNCSSLTSVTIPNSVTSIERGAFQGCSSLPSVTIPNSVTTIEDNAFQGCSKLTSVTIPNSVRSIGKYAFFGCSSLTSVTIPNGVTSIGDNTFFECSSLTSVTIPNSVTSIADEAFYGCSSLTSVTINSDAIVNKDYSIADNLKTIFGSQVTKYIIGPTVKGIGSFAFQGCLGLSSVTIPNSVTSIGDYAFGDCSKLSSVHISDIAAWCQISFGNTSANPLIYAHNLYLNGDIVTDLVIPNSVTSIGDYAFIYCSGLSSVTIPSSVTTIGKYAFMACNNLYDVYCYATTPPTADQSSFTNYNAFLHVLCNNQQMYLSDEVFGKFQSVVCLGADDVMTNGVTVAPGKNDVVITWPTEGSANSYTLEIKKDGMVFCTLTFNANGQLTGIAFMPRPDGSTPAKAATSVGAGYQFTVTGLDGASHYTYELTTKDAENQVIASYTGEFSTEGFTALEDAVIPSLRVVDGAVVCDEPYTIYDISGRDVTNQNGTLQGVYIVRTAKGAVKVAF